MRRLRFLLPFFLTVTVFFTACCNCGSNNENIVKGVITMVGNDQFARLAVKVDNNKAYLLECTKDVEEELMKNQGNSYAIQFSSSRDENGVPVLKVEKISKINPSNNN